MQLLIIIRVARNRAVNYPSSTLHSSASIVFKSTLGSKVALRDLERMDPLASTADPERG